MKSDLETDIKKHERRKSKLEESKTGIVSLLKLSAEQMENLGRIEIKIKFNTRRNIEANYEGFRSSGKIGYIETRELKNEILSYYQENMSVTTEMEKDLNSVKKEIIELLSKNEFKATALKDPI